MAASQPGVTVRDFCGEDDPDDAVWHHRLTVTCDDRAGLLADLSEHLRAHDVDIVSAAVATDTESGHIVDSFAVRGHAALGAAPARSACAAAQPRRKGVTLERLGQCDAAVAPLKPRRRFGPRTHAALPAPCAARAAAAPCRARTAQRSR